LGAGDGLGHFVGVRLGSFIIGCILLISSHASWNLFKGSMLRVFGRQLLFLRLKGSTLLVLQDSQIFFEALNPCFVLLRFLEIYKSNEVSVAAHS
jgi:hypothetical protein